MYINRSTEFSPDFSIDLTQALFFLDASNSHPCSASNRLNSILRQCFDLRFGRGTEAGGKVDASGLRMFSHGGEDGDTMLSALESIGMFSHGGEDGDIILTALDSISPLTAIGVNTSDGGRILGWRIMSGKVAFQLALRRRRGWKLGGIPVEQVHDLVLEDRHCTSYCLVPTAKIFPMSKVFQSHREAAMAVQFCTAFQSHEGEATPTAFQSHGEEATPTAFQSHGEEAAPTLVAQGRSDAHGRRSGNTRRAPNRTGEERKSTESHRGRMEFERGTVVSARGTAAMAMEFARGARRMAQGKNGVHAGNCGVRAGNCDLHMGRKGKRRLLMSYPTFSLLVQTGDDDEDRGGQLSCQMAEGTVAEDSWLRASIIQWELWHLHIWRDGWCKVTDEFLFGRQLVLTGSKYIRPVRHDRSDPESQLSNQRRIYDDIHNEKAFT
ncbi:hypothetical protein Taro_023500 [Colocasia esculenta]|uniref:Uncharacterized protein n=1 Tax=Colocasia esculenta TaxID=4460 RepID=A0A843V6N2_COLES|nr:hypothetical protein [Colocasia esculenta]